MHEGAGIEAERAVRVAKDPVGGQRQERGAGLDRAERRVQALIGEKRPGVPEDDRDLARVGTIREVFL